MKPRAPNSAILGALLLGLASAVVAHGGDEEMNMKMGNSAVVSPAASSSAEGQAPNTYFRYGEHSGILMAHIFLMTIAWVFILPIGVMFSIAASRYRFLVQFIFLAVNGIGLFLATIYNASTPDLYPNNAHHKLGWVLTWVLVAQVVMGVISTYTKRASGDHRGAFIPISTANMEQHLRMHAHLQSPSSCRFSNDSGQGTELNTESLRSQSISSNHSDEHQLPELHPQEDDEEDEKHGVMRGGKVDRFLAKRIPRLLSSRVLRFLGFFYNVVDRVILILGFVALTTGIVTYGGFFMGEKIFSGLAHWIKGGIFFWYGILTLGRWTGCFAEIGWAWNIRSSSQGGRRITAEFAESFLIFFYGASNVFLEHLTAWGRAWTATDLEHISITIMFFGGGLCGMLVESTFIRSLLSTRPSSFSSSSSSTSEDDEEPATYRVPINPLPALIVLLTGMMMSSHHQESMVSTMVHAQWGNLLVGAAFARAATYVVFYLAPPKSTFPGRPPTELITAFALMAGGMVFMSSARDCVEAMEANHLDAMFIFTVSMGVITFLMAWIIGVIALKGWAVRKQNRSLSASISSNPTGFGYRQDA